MKGNPKIIRSWCMYDWANSVYNLVINTSIFPIYYTAITASEGSGDYVDFFGFKIVNSVLYSYALSFSYLLSALILPLLSGIADYTGKKMTFLKIFTFLGAFSCMGMFLFTKGNIEWGIFCVIFASLGYSSSLVFYDAYLPEIATPEQTDRVSARGYAYGYLGSALMLIMSLILITYYETFGFENTGQATRLVFLLVGIWWISFAQIPFNTLPVNVFHKKPKGRILLNGYREIRSVFFRLRTLSNMKKYILAFLFFNMGVQTVMLLATLFGSKVLHLEAGQLIPILLIIQFVGIAGSLLFARLSDRKGNIFSLTIMIIIWIGICLYAFFITNVTQFYIIAVLVGLVMGGIQALSRATFSKLIPEETEDHASYFSFFDVTFHISVVLGTFSYGLIEQMTGSMRNSSLALGLFFLIGLVILRFVKLPPYGKA
ncbi:MAG: MFS transporter [Cyclobacteriaceae bacterium]